MNTRPVILYACIHNAGRSVAAEALTRHHAGNAVDVRSAGSEPGDAVDPVVAAVLAERGLSVGGHRPNRLDRDRVAAADVVVTMGCGESCPVFPGKRYEDWPVDDPAGQDVDTVRRIVADIDHRVRQLLAELSVTRKQLLTNPHTPHDGCVEFAAGQVDESVPDRWTASTVYPDMWVDPDDDPRDTGTELTDERSTLAEYLRAYRLTLQMKCAALPPEQLARRSVPPSTMSLLGLIRHLAEVERSWFRRVMAGQAAPRLYSPDDQPGGDWAGAVADPAVVEDAWRSWRDEVAFAEEFVDRAGDLGVRGTLADGGSIQLREVLVHMIEEYARHCGHADLLRERIDGRVGQ